MIIGMRARAVRIRTSRARRSRSRSGTSFSRYWITSAPPAMASSTIQVRSPNVAQAADQDHQPGFAQRSMRGHRGHRHLLDRVDIVAQDLEPAGEPDVDQLAVFFQRPQGLGDPLEVRGEDGAGVLAAPFGHRHDVGADVLAGVAGVDQEARVQAALGVGQPVADLLQTPGEAGIVEGEADVILDDAQPLASRDWPRRRGFAPGRPRRRARRAPAEGSPRPSAAVPSSTRTVSVRWSLQRLELQAGRAEQLRGRIGARDQPGEEMLRAHLALAIDPARLGHRLAQDHLQGRRLGNRLGPLRARLGIRLERLDSRDDFQGLGTHGCPETARLDTKLRHQLRGSAFGLERQRRQQVQRFHGLSAATPRHRFGAGQGSLRTRGKRFEHQDDDSVIALQTSAGTPSPRPLADHGPRARHDRATAHTRRLAIPGSGDHH